MADLADLAPKITPHLDKSIGDRADQFVSDFGQFTADDVQWSINRHEAYIPQFAERFGADEDVRGYAREVSDLRRTLDIATREVRDASDRVVEPRGHLTNAERHDLAKEGLEAYDFFLFNALRNEDTPGFRGFESQQ